LLSDTALSAFARVERLRVVPGFTCSLASGDSDVFFMKKTPFYQMIRHCYWFQCKFSHLHRSQEAAEISLHSHIKRTVASQNKQEGDRPSLVQCQAYIRLRSLA
jgi:hypothetical protein